MLTVIKRNGKYKIKNKKLNKIYQTEYVSKKSAEQKVKIMNDWFIKYKSKVNA